MFDRLLPISMETKSPKGTHIMKRTIQVMLASLTLYTSMALFAGCSQAGTREPPTPTPLPTPVIPINPTYEVQRGEVVLQLQFTARVSPAIEQELFFRTTGRVRNVYVKRGDDIEAGKLLADLEVLDDLERRLLADQLDLRRAQVVVEIAKTTLEMTEAQPWTSSKEYEVAIKQYEVELAEIALEEASMAMEDLEDAIADAQIVSPMNGQLLSITLAEGKAVNAYETVAVVADLRELEASAELGSQQMQSLAEGMPVVVSLVGQPGVEVEGYIRQLPYPYGGGSKDVEGGDSYTHVALNVPESGTVFELSDLVRVTVVLERKEDVLWIPLQVVRTFEGRKFVVVQDGDVQRRVDVKLGIQGEDRVEVLEGLSEEQIVMGP
jgi:macrolide-specific efflux system membrane fusion protein